MVAKITDRVVSLLLVVAGLGFAHIEQGDTTLVWVGVLIAVCGVVKIVGTKLLSDAAAVADDIQKGSK